MSTEAARPEPGTEAVVDHLIRCRGADAAIVMQEGSADEIVASYLAAGWTLEDQADEIAGKRIRVLAAPPGQPEGTP